MKKLDDDDFATLMTLSWAVTGVHANEDQMSKSAFGGRVLTGTGVLALYLYGREGGPLLESDTSARIKLKAPIGIGTEFSSRSVDLIDPDADVIERGEILLGDGSVAAEIELTR